MNDQQLQQILTIQQAIAAAATAAVINSLLNPQQAASGISNPNVSALTEALQNAQNQIDLQHPRPDSRQDSPIATSSSPATNTQPLNDASRLQELLLHLQQQASIGTGSGVANQPQQQQQAALLAALNLNLNNANNIPLQQQSHSHMAASPLSQSPSNSRLQLGQAELNLTTATGSNISNQSSPSKKLKNRHTQQHVVPAFTPPSKSSLDATNKPQQHQTALKSHHSTLANLSSRNNANNNSSTSSSFLPNSVGLPRKLVRGQDVWLGRGAEQTRQILKCMWCGQSFRTLAEMTQHMRETQHYTNIISQEQITSWRQPDGTESNSKPISSKQSGNNARMADDHLDEMSEKFNDSEDSFSNDDEASPRRRSVKRPLNKSPTSKRDPESNNDSTLLNQCPTTLKPSTKYRKRDLEDLSRTSTKREKLEEGQSPSSTNSNHHRVFNSLDGNLDASREIISDSDDQENSSSNRVLGNDDRECAESSSPSTKSENDKQEGSQSPEQRTKYLDHRRMNQNDADENAIENDDGSTDNVITAKNDLDKQDDAECEDDESDLNQADDEENKSDNKGKRRSGKKQSDIDSASGTKPAVIEAQKVDASGDPLSALETMVEKSFDPRMRPGLASGGILQRLGIDEEVCPPWQHINYANWYAAAAYGHPMAAALLAAGINLQNGIKLGKNLSAKKTDDD